MRPFTVFLLLTGCAPAAVPPSDEPVAIELPTMSQGPNQLVETPSEAPVEDRLETHIEELSKNLDTLANTQRDVSDALGGLTDAMDGITRYGDVREMVLRGSFTFDTDTCAGLPITFTFDARRTAYAWRCGESSSSIAKRPGLDLGVMSSTPKEIVNPFDVCQSQAATLTVPADRSFVTLDCPFTGTTQTYDDGEWYVFVFP